MRRGEDADYRACQAEKAEASLAEYRLRRRIAWRLFRATADRYRTLRAAIAGTSLAA